MSKKYRTFEEYWKDCDDADTMAGTAYQAWLAGRADLSAILGEFEALAGKWKEDMRGASAHNLIKLGLHHDGELSALIQSVKERM